LNALVEFHKNVFEQTKSRASKNNLPNPRKFTQRTFFCG